MQRPIDAARGQLAMIDAATNGVEAYRTEKDATQIEGDKA